MMDCAVPMATAETDDCISTRKLALGLISGHPFLCTDFSVPIYLRVCGKSFCAICDICVSY